jgi:hypothetical protein
MLLSSRFWKKPKDAHHKHHSSEALKDNMHVKLLQTSALLLQLAVETRIDAIITQKMVEWSIENPETSQKPYPSNQTINRWTSFGVAAQRSSC